MPEGTGPRGGWGWGTWVLVVAGVLLVLAGAAVGFLILVWPKC